MNVCYSYGFPSYWLFQCSTNTWHRRYVILEFSWICWFHQQHWWTTQLDHVVPLHLCMVFFSMIVLFVEWRNWNFVTSIVLNTCKWNTWYISGSAFVDVEAVAYEEERNNCTVVAFHYHLVLLCSSFSTWRGLEQVHLFAKNILYYWIACLNV